MIHIMISPAKKMNDLEEYAVQPGMPVFLERTERLLKYLQGLDKGMLQDIWKCSDKLADLNWQRLRTMELRRFVTPAVFSYEGIQYQSMAPGVFEKEHLEYIGSRLYILSGFYGVLRAFDGVTPYRLEMQARISMEEEGRKVTSLYEYWGDRLYQVLAKDASVLVNLASEEYSRAVKPWASIRESKSLGCRIVDCVFGQLEERNGKKNVRVKATAAKMARGAMVRFMAEHQVEDEQQIKAFNWMGYEYRDDLSEENRLVFVQKQEKIPLDK